jgi:aryl-alcohol dehydrogenase-like predicted oxidoreductase
LKCKSCHAQATESWRDNKIRPLQLWFVDEAEAARMIRHAPDRGVNYFDIACVYHEGNSETVLGKALRGHRDRVRIATKSPVWLKRFEPVSI